MSVNKKYVIWILLLAVGFWVLDSLVDALFFSPRSFLENLILNPAPHDIYMRVLCMIFIVVPGLILTRAFDRRRMIEGELKRSSSLLNAIVEGTSDAIYVKDSKGKYLLVNQSGAKMAGKAVADFLGNDDTTLLTRDEAKLVMQGDRQVMQSSAPQTYEEKITLADGQTHTFLSTKGPVTDLEGGAPGLFGIARDITPSKKAEQALRESQSELERFFQLVPDLVCIASTDGYFKKLNQAWETTLGYTTTELLSRPFEYFLHPDDIEPTRREVTRQVGGGRTVSFINRYRAKDGTYKWLDWNAVPAKNGSELFAAARDITEHNNAQLEVQKSEDMYRSLFENMLNGFAYCQMIFEDNQPCDFIYLSVNQAFEKQTGLKNVTGRKVSDVIPGIVESDRQLLETYGRVASTAIPASFETYVAALKMWFEISVYCPQIGYFVAVFDVITERKLAEIKTQEETIRRRILIDQSRDGIVVLDNDGRVFEANQQFARMLGYSHEEVRHLLVWDWEFLFASEKTLEMIRSVDEKGDHFETRHRRKDGSIFDVEISTNAATFSGQKLIFCVCRDISQRKQAEDKLEQAYQQEKHLRIELQEEAKARSMFIDILGHELRTPLTPLVACSLMLQDILGTHAAKTEKRLIENICSGANSLTLRLEELLEMARYSRGTFKLQNQPVDMAELLNKTVTQFKPQAEMQLKRLVTKIQPDLPEIEADPARLEQVLTNLLSNAIKYSPSHTTVTLRARQSGPDIIVELQDEGIGVSAEDQKKLFDPYHRVMQDTQKYPGIGLGLAICKQIVEAHGGSIWIESEMDKGSTFFVRIPIKSVELKVDEQTGLYI